MEKLQRVDMSWMFLEFLPNPPVNLAGITKLDLSNNNLEIILKSLATRLLNVIVLDVHSNQLRSLPNSIGCLIKLKVLNVSDNSLESLPKSIKDCRALEKLIANFNKLTKLPEIGQAASLANVAAEPPQANGGCNFYVNGVLNYVVTQIAGQQASYDLM